MSGKKVVLVTGGTGLVGKAMEEFIKGKGAADAADEEWVFLSSKDGDLRSREETFAVFARYKPTAVIHLAAFVGGLFRNMKYKVEFYRWVPPPWGAQLGGGRRTAGLGSVSQPRSVRRRAGAGGRRGAAMQRAAL